MQDIYGSIFLSECDLKITDAAFRIYVYLRLRQNVKDECWPSLNRIAKDTGKTVMTVTRALKQLEDKNLVKVLRTQIAVGMNAVNRHQCTIQTIKSDQGTNKLLEGETEVLTNCESGTIKLLDKNKQYKINKDNDDLNAIKAKAKELGSFIKIRKDHILKLLETYSVSDILTGVESASRYNEKHKRKTWLTAGHIEFAKDKNKFLKKRQHSTDMTQDQLKQFYENNKIKF